MHSGDCYLYKIHCSCGIEKGGWTPDEAEGEFNEHIGVRNDKSRE